MSVFVGLMSGTSLDGLDVVVAELSSSLLLKGAKTFSFDPALQQMLASLTKPGDNEIERLAEADILFALFAASSVNQMLRELDISTAEVTAIGSHGQTIRHIPEKGFSLQIGDPNVLAEHTGIKVVADFRRRDLAAGGQGAPLVPAFHQWLFRNPSHDRIIVNIGGISNLTIIPCDTQIPITGYDSGPGNLLLDDWIKQHKRKPFDQDGAWAREGVFIPQLVNRLLADDYFSKPPPKSTGREYFNPSWLQLVLNEFELFSDVDVQRSLLELTCRCISDAIKSHPLNTAAEVFICGGGAHNGLMMQRLTELLQPFSVSTTESLGLHPDWVEGAAFAWLAQQTLIGSTGNAPDVTGAKGNRVLGAIYQA